MPPYSILYYLSWARARRKQKEELLEKLFRFKNGEHIFSINFLGSGHKTLEYVYNFVGKFAAFPEGQMNNNLLLTARSSQRATWKTTNF